MDIKEFYMENQIRLREIIRKPEYFSEAISLTKHQHALTHMNVVSNSTEKTVLDELMSKIRDRDLAIMPGKQDVTIAWNLWHITRIEDLTINLLVAKRPQILDDSWSEKLGTRVTDTGNAMSDRQIIALSKELRLDGFLAYRSAVGLRSREILSALHPEDMKRKIDRADTEKILEVGGVTEEEESIWLLDFWGKKDIAGILLMPLTRHQIGHMLNCFKLKEKIDTKKRYYLG